MEFGVVENDDSAGFELWQERRCQPFVEDILITRAVEEHRRNQFVAKATADQAGARAFVSRYVAVNSLSDACPAVRTARRGRKACFIEIKNIALLLQGFVKLLEESFSSFFIEPGFCVTCGFFYG